MSKLSNGVAAILFSVNVIFIGIATMCVIEVASRLSARSFMEQKINESVIEFAKVRADGIDAKSLEPSSALQNRILQYRLVVDDLNYLELSGSRDPSQSVGYLRSRLQQIANSDKAELISRALSESIDGKFKEKELLIKDLQKIEIDRRKLMDVRANIESNFNNPNTEERKDQERINSIQMEELDQISDVANKRITILSKEIDSFGSNLIDLSSSNKADLDTGKNLFSYFSFFPSDLIVAVSVILCGCIGSSITAIRRRERAFISVFTGLLAGFITFLVVKGGRFFFLINLSGSDHIYLNPYALAFSGILAGMFTDKAYQILSEIADTVAERLSPTAADSDEKPVPTASASLPSPTASPSGKSK